MLKKIGVALAAPVELGSGEIQFSRPQNSGLVSFKSARNYVGLDITS